jgi:hypothetical protein
MAYSLSDNQAFLREGENIKLASGKFWLFAFLGWNIEVPTQLPTDEKINKYIC